MERTARQPQNFFMYESYVLLVYITYTLAIQVTVKCYQAIKILIQEIK